MIDAAGIPQIDADLDAVEAAAGDLSTAGGDVRETGGAVHRTWQGLAGCYTAPESGQLLAATQPVVEVTDKVATDSASAAGALRAFAAEARPLQAQLRALRSQASAFTTKVSGDEEWRKDGALVDEHNGMMGDVAGAVAAWQAAERRCANALRAVADPGALSYVADDGDGRLTTTAAGVEYGMSGQAWASAGAPGAGGVAWGESVEEDHPWWHDAGSAVGGAVKSFGTGMFVDGAWGDLKGLGDLVGFGGLEGMAASWGGIAKLAASVTPLSVVNEFVALPGLEKGELGETLKATGKALTAWDMWSQDPARALGTVLWAPVSLVASGGVAGAAKAGAVGARAGRAASTAGHAGSVGRTAGALRSGRALSHVRVQGFSGAAGAAGGRAGFALSQFRTTLSSSLTGPRQALAGAAAQAERLLGGPQPALAGAGRGALAHEGGIGTLHRETAGVPTRTGAGTPGDAAPGHGNARDGGSPGEPRHKTVPKETLHPKTPYSAQTLDPHTVYHLDGRGEIHTDADGEISKIVAQPGHKGAWNAELNHPLPNVRYEIENANGSKLVVQTDGSSRATRVEIHSMQNSGTDTRLRFGDAQQKTGALGRLTDPFQRRYDGGHWLGNRFGGPGERVNLFPQLRNVNRGQFRRLEDSWRKLLDEDPDGGLDVEFDVRYDGEDARPSQYMVHTYQRGEYVDYSKFAN